MNLYKGQTIYSGQAVGIVLCKAGPHAVKVRTVRTKLVMAGTFPDKPIGEARQTVTETWPLRCVQLFPPPPPTKGTMDE